MCVPSSCSGDDVVRGLQLLLGRKVSVSALQSTTSEDSVEFTPPDRAVITIMVLFGGLMVAGTCLDLHYRGCTRRLMAMLQLKPGGCLGPTWYLDLAVDVQLFAFSPLVLLPLFHFRSERSDLWARNYKYPWMRCTVWLVGIGLGFLLHKLRGRRVTLRPWQYLPGWIAAFAVGISVVYGMYGYQMPWDPTPSKAVAVAYGGLHRLAWGLAVSWVIFACVTGYGGVINTFLSHPGFVPLSRLTYAGYLIHDLKKAFHTPPFADAVEVDETVELR
ncbi:nose resistant to fluoxetine protein 6-like [Pollicipes pollicipes]|uniref:nose resistant to fluoxetine protein 6-like n=1 Tax=Pollicipes pollicipes TaxID=41117 RepID=UPI00188492F8|nr:nose resistant to fluoxetine protein 6-like [Pollicipes pollicipes]